MNQLNSPQMMASPRMYVPFCSGSCYGDDVFTVTYSLGKKVNQNKRSAPDWLVPAEVTAEDDCSFEMT